MTTEGKISGGAGRVSQKMQKATAGGSIALAVVLTVLGLRATPLLDGLQATLSHGLYSGRELGDEIVIVALDDATLASVEDGGSGGINDLTREKYASVLNEIESAEPSVVMFDILFTNASNGISSESLIEISKDQTSFESFATEVLDYGVAPHPYDEAFAEALGRYDNVYLLKWINGEGEFNGDAFVYPGATLPLDIFSAKAELAFPNAVSTADENENTGTIYAMPTRFSVDGVVEEHMDLQLARAYLAAQGADGGAVDLGIPVENGQMLINYAAESYSFPMYSLVDVYNGEVPASAFEGKIVLIGATAAILQDRHFTPIDENVPMPGVEIQANAIQTILDGAFLRHQGAGGFVAMVSAMVLAGVAAFLYLPVLAGAGVLVALVAAFPFLAKWSFGRGVILDLIWPMFAVVAAYLAVLAYRNFTEFREKRKLKSAFGHYVSPELVSQISENPEALKLGGERRELSVMFLDIENFTNLAESLEAQEVVGIINTYFDALAQVIMANGGTVDKFEGDAIMALFGAPLPSEDHGVRACRAAVALRARVAELNKETGRNLNIRIGIATGEAIVGNMGSAERFDYTAMGDTVNTASRLEGANKFYKTGILVNPGTFEAAQSEIFFRKIDLVCLKGKDNAIAIYEVMGSQECASEEGKALVAEWHGALEDYKAANWEAAEKKVKSVLAKLPEDGPAQTFLARIAELKMVYIRATPGGDAGLRPVWDGVWRFESK